MDAKYQKVGVIDAGFLQHEEFRLAWWVMCLEEVLAWHCGIVLDAYQIKRVEGGFLLRVQGRRAMSKKSKTGVVAWAQAHSAFACFKLFAAQVRSNAIEWKHDKYPVFDKPT